MSQAQKILLHFVRKVEIKNNVTCFYFSFPKGFSYQAGQYLQFTIPHKADDYGTSRYFSIASAPSEKEIMIAIKKGPSSFKEKLFAMQIGETIEAFGPIGKFVLED